MYSKTSFKSYGFLFLLLFLFSSCRSYQDYDENNYLDVPFICIDPCYKSLSGINYTTKLESQGTLNLVFSVRNAEANFIGYKIWYGEKDAVRKAHQEKDFSYTLDPIGSTTLDTKYKSDFELVSLQSTAGASKINFIIIDILNVESGKYVYVTSSSEEGYSQLSNGFQIP